MYIPESSSVTLPPTADVLDEVEPGANTRLNQRLSLSLSLSFSLSLSLATRRELNVSIEA
jgi:hypothetical protein